MKRERMSRKARARERERERESEKERERERKRAKERERYDTFQDSLWWSPIVEFVIWAGKQYVNHRYGFAHNLYANVNSTV